MDDGDYRHGGAVSLAASLAVPQTVTSGAPFPGRDLIVFVTAGVIAVTLAQSLLRHLAETLATEEALAVLPHLATELGTDQDVVERLRDEYEEHLRVLHAGAGAVDEPALRHEEDYTALRRALLARKRVIVIKLVTSAGSTTPCSGRCREGSTSRRSACPATSWSTRDAAAPLSRRRPVGDEETEGLAKLRWRWDLNSRGAPSAAVRHNP